jgi:hypothetical protein
MTEYNYDQHVYDPSSSSFDGINYGIEVPNITRSNKQHWEAFKSSPIINNQVYSCCDICGLQFSEKLTGHIYSFQRFRNVHEFCMYTHLGLCKCKICGDMIKFITHIIKSFKSDNKSQSADVRHNYWLRVANLVTEQMSHLTARACIVNRKVAEDDVVPDLESPNKSTDPVFTNNRCCYNTNMLKHLYANAVLIYNREAKLHEEAIQNQTEVPPTPVPYIQISGLPYGTVFISLETVDDSLRSHDLL